MRAWWLAVAACALLFVFGPTTASAQETVELAADAQDAFFRGVGLLEAGDPTAALEAFDEAASIQPDFRRVYYYRARALIDLTRLDEAAASLKAYSRFELPEAEADQAQELQNTLDAALSPDGPTVEPDEPAVPDPVPEPETSTTDPSADAEAELDAAAVALDEKRCGDALASSQRAMRLDPGRVRVFLMKGLALECAGDLTRARSVLITYLELAIDPDPAAAEALDRISGVVAPPAPDRTAEPPKEKPAQTTLGDDPAISGVLDQRFGTSEPRKGRTVVVPQVGAARYKSLRMRLAGSGARGEQLALWHQGQLVWARVRIDDGGDSDWFGRAFDELVQRIAQDSGDPTTVKKDGSPGSALDGRARYEATWTDRDGDRLRLRLGQCAKREGNLAVLPENGPCLELTGASGSWTPSEDAQESDEAVAAALVRTPGNRAFDFSVGIGGGGGFGFLIDRQTGAPSVAPEAGADLLIRFNIGAFAAGLAWSPGAAGYAGTVNSGPFFESRLTFYVGLRAGNREPHSTDILFGGGLLPQVNAFGLPAASPVVAFRIIDNFRRAPMGIAWVSFEPWVMISDLEVRVVPMRFTVGGAVSTKARLGSGNRDSDWGPLFDEPEAATERDESADNSEQDGSDD
jgi:tetratricopeptide (TPR) repeat protein